MTDGPIHSGRPGPLAPRSAVILAGLLRRRIVVVALILAAAVAFVTAVNPAFASIENLRDLLVQSTPVVIVGCGLTLVVLTGEIDISVGSLLGLLAALMGVLASPQRLGAPVPVAVFLTLAAGGGVGLLNGLLVTVGRVPSIIATLGTLTILRGITEWVMGGEWIVDLPPGLRTLGTGSAAGVPICLWVAGITGVAALVLTRCTPLGLRIYAVGGNPIAASAARISAARIKILAFTLTGLLTAVAALVSVPQQSVIDPGIGANFELVVVTAVVVGGTSIRGGRGGVAGTVLAAVLLGSIRTILVFLNLGETATYWERAIQGAFILGAVLADHLASRAAPGSTYAGPEAAA